MPELVLFLLSLLAPREPSAADLNRFPDLATAVQALADQEIARAFFQRRYDFAIPESDEQKLWGAALWECQRCREAWGMLAYARQSQDSDNENDGRPKWAVLLLRNELTPLQWRTGCMPPSIPTWRFPRE